MKKYLLLAPAALLVLASCSNDEMKSGDGDQNNVTVTINLPDALSSRADDDAAAPFGGGLVATNLTYAVYDGTSFVTQGSTTFPAGSLKTTVGLSLSKGKSYNIVFFAQAPGSEDVYTVNVNPANGDPNVTVDYTAMTSAGNLADLYDCFYAAIETPVISKSMANLSAVLERPVAQINWGATDPEGVAFTDGTYGEEGEYVWSTLSTSAYTQLNLLEGTVSTQVPVVLGNNQEQQAFAAPWQYEFPYTNPDGIEYVYVAMQYVLAPSSTAENYNLTLALSNQGNTSQDKLSEASLVVANVPVQANYRTNIFGDLLSGDANFTVVKNPLFNQPAYGEEYPQ